MIILFITGAAVVCDGRLGLNITSNAADIYINAAVKGNNVILCGLAGVIYF